MKQIPSLAGQLKEYDAGMAVFPLLVEPVDYRACKWDLLVEDVGRDYWLALFRRHFPSLLAMAVEAEMDRGRTELEARKLTDDAHALFCGYLDELTSDPGRYGRLDILTICHQRELVLRHVGIDDPYRLAKQRANEQSLLLLPDLLARLDTMSVELRRVLLIEGIFAGNIFDLGATETVAMFQNNTIDFQSTRSRLKHRPWFMDDLDAWLHRLDERVYRSAILFVDNSGPDIVLGMIPFTRELIRQGSRVVLTANSKPSLNDITHDELVVLMQRVADMDPIVDGGLSDGHLMLIPSGNWAPLIDLSRVSTELAQVAACEPVDLVVLEGMGRAIETNYDAKLTCDTLKIAMIKDRGVADALGADLFDLVLRFEQVLGIKTVCSCT